MCRYGCLLLPLVTSPVPSCCTHLQSCTGTKPKPKREPREAGVRQEDALAVRAAHLPLTRRRACSTRVVGGLCRRVLLHHRPPPAATWPWLCRPCLALVLPHPPGGTLPAWQNTTCLANPASSPRPSLFPQDLTQEERQDRHKVLLARMAQLHLDGLVDMTHEHAK